MFATMLARLIPYIAWGGAALATAAVGVYVNGRLKKSSHDLDDQHHREIIADILDFFNIPSSTAKNASTALMAAMESGLPVGFGGLRDLKRIEASYSKADAGKDVCRQILVYCPAQRGGTAVAKIERRYDYAYIPMAIRSEFIRTKKDRVTVLLYEQKGAGHD